MNSDEIKNNPSLSELQEQAKQLKTCRKFWPFLKPIAKLLGADTDGVDETIHEAMKLAKQIEEMTAIPDRFNDIFSERGWILFESMELEVAKQAIEIAETDGVDEAEEFLVEYFSPAWVELQLNRLKNIRGFPERFELAKLAVEDYKEGRYYASVLVVLSLIDGWVSELNIIDFHRHGFFSEKSQLVAWDSITAHPKGLAKLQKVFGKSRMMTRTEEIRIPYRHGIIHGMDLGYNNKYVAAKCWATLFAVRDWAIKAAKGELIPPALKPEAEKTLWESIENYQRVRAETEWLKKWRPREVIIGKTIPVTGMPEDYPTNSPEQKIVEFLMYWQKDNYGFMANCFAPFLHKSPGEVRDLFSHMHLIEFELMAVKEISSAITDVMVKLKLVRGGSASEEVYEFRLALSDKNGDLVYIKRSDTTWGITTWRNVS